MDDMQAQIYESWAFASDASNEKIFDSITRRQLHDELLARIREFIISGKLKDGSKIPEKELCDYFGISRTPLREALKVMAFEGLISLAHNRGATIKPLTIADLKETYPIYAHLTALAGKLACKRLSDAEIENLLQMHEKLSSLCHEDQFTQFIVIDDLVHSRIEHASANPSLLKMLQIVSGRVRRARLSLHASQARLEIALAEHERIMANLKKRDVAGLSEAIKDHVESSFRFYEYSISRLMH